MINLELNTHNVNSREAGTLDGSRITSFLLFAACSLTMSINVDPRVVLEGKSKKEGAPHSGRKNTP